MVQQYSGPVMAIALRDGSAFAVFNDRIETRLQAFGMPQLTYAALVADPAAVAGQPAAPAIRLALRDGTTVDFVPADPPDAQRALEAIYALRPDLRSARRPRAVATTGDAYPLADHHERLVAVCAHLSVFVAPLLLPLIFWFATRQTMPYASRQARQAFWFNLGTIVAIAFDIGVVVLLTLGSALWAGATNDSGPLGAGFLVILLGGLVAVGLAITSVVFSVIGAVQSFRGIPFSYPFLRRV